ncbi:hypothetical protein, partial [Escherichia coli]
RAESSTATVYQYDNGLLNFLGIPQEKSSGLFYYTKRQVMDFFYNFGLKKRYNTEPHSRIAALTVHLHQR